MSNRFYRKFLANTKKLFKDKTNIKLIIHYNNKYE